MSAADLAGTAAAVALFAPLVVALLLGAVPPLRRVGALAAVLSIAAAITALACAVLLALPGADAVRAPQVFFPTTWLTSAGAPLVRLGLNVDGTSVVMLLVLTCVALAVQVYSWAYLHDEPRPSLGRYYAVQSLFLFAMEVLVLAPNLLQFFLGWELVGVSSFLLIGYWYRKPSAARAALKAFWVTKLADTGFLLALVLLYHARSDFQWDPAGLSPTSLTVVTLLLVLAVMGKSAQFPLHVWLPDAMEGPTPVSALLHAATMVAAGVYLVVRAFPLFAGSGVTLAFLGHLGAFTALFAAAIAVVQTDVKKVLAYSTCSQLGVMLAALGASGQFAGFFHLTTHAAFKALLFLAAGNVIHAVGSNELSDMGGLRRRMPVTFACFSLGALALSGLPGLAGFFSKDLVLEAVAERGWTLALAALVLGAALTAYYMGRVVFLTFLGEPATAGARETHEAPAVMLLPVLALAVPSVILGWFAVPLASFTGAGDAGQFHVGAPGIAGSVAALLGLGLAWLVHGARLVPGSMLAPLAPAGRLARSGAVDGLHLVAYRRLIRGLAGWVGWCDRYLVDGVMNAIGAAVVASGRSMRRLQTGQAADAVWYVLAGATLLAAAGALR